MSSEMDQNVDGTEEENSGSEIKSIEINLNIIKTFFINTISLYEHMIKNMCQSCDIVSSDEFITLHRNLLEFESIFKVFDVSFNKQLLTNFVKNKQPHEESAETLSPIIVNSKNNTPKPTVKYPCYVNSCTQLYSSEEGSKIHFIKSHCKKGDVFEAIPEKDSKIDLNIDWNTFKKNKDGKYHCPAKDCRYSSSDRSNFKVHSKRHAGGPRFVCVCKKKFFTRDPLMIHFVRLHMKDIDWNLANTDIKLLRKFVRKTINRKYYDLKSIDDIPESDSDLNGPEDDAAELNDFITRAIASGNVSAAANPEEKEIEEQDVDISMVDDSNPINSFDVSLNLKENHFFVDSVAFRAEGVEDEMEELMKNPGARSVKKRRIAISEIKDKVIKMDIPQRRRKYKCPHNFCQQEFFTTKNLLVHLKASHDPANPVLCTEPGCWARYKSKALLAQHLRRHQVKYTCSLCPYQTHLAALMARHNRQHAGKAEYHECQVCQEKFEYLGALTTHMQKVHQEKEPLKCDFPECNKKFKTIVGLRKHTREFHMNMKNEFPCDWPNCNAVFSCRTNRINHIRIHTNERPYRCVWPNCGKYFRLHETLKRHMKLHQGIKSYSCPFDHCDEAFNTKRSQKRHIEKVHFNHSASNSEEAAKLAAINDETEDEDEEDIDIDEEEQEEIESEVINVKLE